MRGNCFARGLKIAFFVALAIVGMGFLVMLLWNWLIPDIFSGPKIHFGQALGILVLSKILFGGFKGGGSWGRRESCGSYGGGKHYWKEKMEAKMANMTPEEREKFKLKMSRCGWSPEEKKVTE